MQTITWIGLLHGSSWMKAAIGQCFALLLVYPPFTAASRDPIILNGPQEGSAQSALPSLDPFVTTRNERCKTVQGVPACVASTDWSGGTYLWCFTETGSWDYCTRSAQTTSYGKTCQDAGNVQIQKLPLSKPYAWCRTTDGTWDYCRYPDSDYAEMRSLCDASQRIRTGSLKSQGKKKRRDHTCETSSKLFLRKTIQMNMIPA